MYETILIATDGGDRAAVEHGLELAALSGATVHALYVIETNAHYVFTAAGHDPETMAEFREYGTGIVEDVVDRAVAKGLDGNGAVRAGSVAREVVDYATQQEIDCIVVGATGPRGIDNYLIGNTTQRVVRTSPVPVTTVRHRDSCY